MKPDPQAEITQRLRCAAGHLDAVIEMVESGKSCEALLHQLNAVQSALTVVGIKLIHCQVQSSQDVILNSPYANRRTAELKRLQSLYMIFTQHFDYPHEVTDD